MDYGVAEYRIGNGCVQMLADNHSEQKEVPSLTLKCVWTYNTVVSKVSFCFPESYSFSTLVNNSQTQTVFLQTNTQSLQA